jgi:ribosome recycling factor
VEYYGALTPLKQLASIAVPDASTLMISPFDKGSLKEIEKAINSSDIGINPNNDGQHIRLNIPAMTQVGVLAQLLACWPLGVTTCAIIVLGDSSCSGLMNGGHTQCVCSGSGADTATMVLWCDTQHAKI